MTPLNHPFAWHYRPRRRLDPLNVAALVLLSGVLGCTLAGMFLAAACQCGPL